MVVSKIKQLFGSPKIFRTISKCGSILYFSVFLFVCEKTSNKEKRKEPLALFFFRLMSTPLVLQDEDDEIIDVTGVDMAKSTPVVRSKNRRNIENVRRGRMSLNGKEEVPPPRAFGRKKNGKEEVDVIEIEEVDLIEIEEGRGGGNGFWFTQSNPELSRKRKDLDDDVFEMVNLGDRRSKKRSFSQSRLVAKRRRFSDQNTTDCIDLTSSSSSSSSSSSFSQTDSSSSSSSSASSSASSSPNGDSSFSNDNDSSFSNDNDSLVALECMCCCEEIRIRTELDVAQCSEGCPLCISCVEKYVKMATFNTGSTSLACPSFEGCTGKLPPWLVRRVVPSGLWNQFTERLQKEELSLCEGINLVYCFSCGRGVDLDLGGKEIKANENSGGKLEEEYSCVFCQKKTCIYCQKEAHIGFSCLELSDAAQPARLSVEERLSEAKIRKCPNLRCRLPFFKSTGCNRMTCQCGTITCYLCRNNIKKDGYKHFCQTPHCEHKKCNKCPLWTTEKQDEERLKDIAQQIAKGETPTVKTKRKQKEEVVVESASSWGGWLGGDDRISRALNYFTGFGHSNALQNSDDDVSIIENEDEPFHLEGEEQQKAMKELFAHRLMSNF